MKLQFSFFMRKEKFKYAINHYLSIQPRPVHISTVASVLQREYDIPVAVFNSDRFLKEEDPGEIPPDRLEIYALLLDIPTEWLVRK